MRLVDSQLMQVAPVGKVIVQTWVHIEVEIFDSCKSEQLQKNRGGFWRSSEEFLYTDSFEYQSESFLWASVAVRIFAFGAS